MTPYLVAKSVSRSAKNYRVPVDSGGMSGGILQTESGSEEGGFEKQHNEILYGFIVLVGVGFLLQFLDDRVVGIQFQVFLGSHVS